MSKQCVSLVDADKELDQQYDSLQLRKLLKHTQEEVKDMEKKIEEISAKFSRFQLESKVKVASLNHKLQIYEKTSKKDDIDLKDSSNTDTSGQHAKGRIIFLKKQLNTSKLLLDKKDKEIEDTHKSYEDRILNLETQLSEKKSVVNISKNTSEFDQATNKKIDEISTKELYAQIVLKDSKILDLNNKLIECERKVLDLHENLKEKNEVLKSRDDAVKLMSADMSYKVKTLVDELEETRHQMQAMQNNFIDIEGEWKQKTSVLEIELKKFETESMEKNSTINCLKENLTRIEAIKGNLVATNADLKKKIVLIKENADKKWDKYQSETHAKVQALENSLEDKILQLRVLQSSFDEATSELESKVLEVGVQERANLKACELELKHLQSEKNNSELVSELMQRIASLEEEHGLLQLRVMESNDTLSLNYFAFLLAHLEIENSKLHGHLKENQEMLCQLKHKIVQISEEKDLQIKNLGLEKNIATLNANNDLLEELAVLKQEKIDLEMQVTELEEICKGSDAQIKEFHEKMYDFLQGNVVDLVQQGPLRLVEAFIEQIVTVKSDKDILASENANLHNENKTLTECLKKSEQGMLGLNNSMEIYEKEITKKDQELALLSSSIELLQEDIAKMFAAVQAQNMQDFFCKWNSQIKELDDFKTSSAGEKVTHCDIERKENVSISSEAKRLQTLIYDTNSHQEDKVNKLSTRLQKEEDHLLAINGEVQILTECLKQKEKQLHDQTVQICHLLMPYQQNEDLQEDTTGNSKEKNMKLTFEDGLLGLQEKLKCDHEMLNKMADEMKQSKELYENTVEKCNFYMDSLSLCEEKYLQLILPIMDAYHSFFSNGDLTSPCIDETTAVQKMTDLLYDNKDNIASICSQNEMLQSRVTELMLVCQNNITYSEQVLHELMTHSQTIIACSEKAKNALLIIRNEKVHIQEDFQELRHGFQDFVFTTVKALSDLNVEVNKKLEESFKDISSLTTQIEVQNGKIHFMEDKLQVKEQQIIALDAEFKKENDENIKHQRQLAEIESLTLDICREYCSPTLQTQMELQTYTDEKSLIEGRLLCLRKTMVNLMESVKALENGNKDIKETNQKLQAELDESKHLSVKKEIINSKLKEVDFQKMIQENNDTQETLSTLLIEKDMLIKNNHALNVELQSSNSKYMDFMDLYTKEKARCHESDDKVTCYQKVILDLESQKEDLNLDLNEQSLQVKKLDTIVYKAAEQKHHLTGSRVCPEITVSHSASSTLAMIDQRLLAEKKRGFEVFQPVGNKLDSTLNAQERRGIIDSEQQRVIEIFNYGDEASDDECRLMLGDPEEQPKMFIETDFSITREVKSWTHAFQRWFRSQRNHFFLHRQRRKYFVFLLILYVCAMHMWLLFCLLGY